MSPIPPRILLLDAYDSFTSNLASLLRTTASASVHTLPIDSLSHSQLLKLLPSFDALVVGPGPGHPSNPSDVGVIPSLWHLPLTSTIPILGVCLGHQALCLAFGAEIRRLETVKHGQISTLRHCGTGLFDGVGEVNAVRYHSLCAVLPEASGELEAQAWAHDAENGEVLMAVRHTKRPFWGVQYHPESICTAGGGTEVIENWWKMVMVWNKAHSRTTVSLPVNLAGTERPKGLLTVQAEYEAATGLRVEEDKAARRESSRKVMTKTVNARGVTVTAIAELLGVKTADEFVLLDSVAAPGRYSIFAVLTSGITPIISYTVNSPTAIITTVGGKTPATTVSLAPYENDIWRFLARYQHARRATGGLLASPFWGGLVGYFNYELGVSTLGLPVLRDAPPNTPDVALAFASRSIVLDTHSGRCFVQSIFANDQEWIRATAESLQTDSDRQMTPAPTPSASPIPKQSPQHPEVIKPDRESYLKSIKKAQEYLSEGNSYELCLTSSTRVLYPLPAPHPWSLYTTLRSRNPAPYAAYVKLGGTTLLSSSPERFLSWGRDGVCQLRPIKGTVRKGPGVTRETAERILRTPKEMAENLMIVDLIRHDLHSLAGDSVVVNGLMAVEEYASVYQLVSVVEGIVSDGVQGVDVLRASLPPGSMTGAPKMRSVQLLAGLEGRERGLYSGVVGYWSVCGAGDWSVVIRSAVGTGESLEGCDVWRVGAGGAITALSVPVDEWEEMVGKAESALGAFAG